MLVCVTSCLQTFLKYYQNFFPKIFFRNSSSILLEISQKILLEAASLAESFGEIPKDTNEYLQEFFQTFILKMQFHEIFLQR